ncbi:endonuclease VII [Pseudomonas phage phiPsa267]|uniref:Endonuclease VII n=2 Tax=Otagovirus TaxID=2560197 RepID=A0A7G9V0V1_9CAUD|nr:endonuclease VII [Pseudomonas phage phiPsa381]YP_010767754.1 endonuclease VII [Pseudomonas phage phiPsa267]QNN99906.1 endonuclease VII [Pseudomonas phage phiPsa267]QNO00600.1 endonuclease VII [Pseudomonas phage phiPsa381]
MAGKKQPPRLNPKCSVCQTALTNDNWSASMQKYRRYICKSCWSVRQKAHAKANPSYNEEQTARRWAREAAWTDERRQLEYEKRKCRYLKKTYGISLEDYNLMLTAQNSSCKICLTTEPRGVGSVFHVDHCHQSGSIRGLLCMACNIMLGKAQDNIETLKAAINYLEEYK